MMSGSRTGDSYVAKRPLMTITCCRSAANFPIDLVCSLQVDLGILLISLNLAVFAD